MKTVLAMLAGLLLLWAQATVIGQPVRAGAETAADACHCNRVCCSPAPSQESPATPVVPTSSLLTHQLLIVASIAPAWELSVAGTDETVFRGYSSPTVWDAPLFERHCALLL